MEETEENGEHPEFTFVPEYFEILLKMIPTIESTGDYDLIRMVYEFARDYYQATQRFSLSNEFLSKLDQLG